MAMPSIGTPSSASTSSCAASVRQGTHQLANRLTMRGPSPTAGESDGRSGKAAGRLKTGSGRPIIAERTVVSAGRVSA